MLIVLILSFVASVLVDESQAGEVKARPLAEVEHPLAHYQDLYWRDEKQHVSLALREGKP